jgi:hypothetical protein
MPPWALLNLLIDHRRRWEKIQNQVRQRKQHAVVEMAV